MSVIGNLAKKPHKQMKILDLNYPKSESKKEIILSSFFIGLFAYFFLLIFQPFGTQNISFAKLAIILFPYAIFTTSTFALTNLYFSLKTMNWTIIREILKLVFIIFICAILSYFYNTLFISKVKISFVNFSYMVLYSFSIAIPLCAVYVLARFIYLNTLNQKNAEEISANIKFTKQIFQPNNEDYIIDINGQIFNERNIIFIESAENYCTVFYLSNEIIQKILLRTTLKSIENQIQSENILRCHRSYIVNFDKVKNAKGNAQGYKLSFENYDSFVPVSRKYLESVNKIFKI